MCVRWIVRILCASSKTCTISTFVRTCSFQFRQKRKAHSWKLRFSAQTSVRELFTVEESQTSNSSPKTFMALGRECFHFTSASQAHFSITKNKRRPTYDRRFPSGLIKNHTFPNLLSSKKWLRPQNSSSSSLMPRSSNQDKVVSSVCQFPKARTSSGIFGSL